MRLVRCDIVNYKSYRNSGPIRFGSGFNVVVGQNNAGKTAFLEALRPTLPNRPHRRLENGKPNTPPLYSSISYTLEVSGEELLQSVLRTAGQHLIPVVSGDPKVAQQQVAAFFQNPKIVFEIEYTADTGWKELTPPRGENFALITVTPSRSAWDFTGFIGGYNQPSTISNRASGMFQEAIYLFRAERLTLSDAAINDEKQLDPNAANLANVILHLQTRSPARFRKLNKWLNAIFPSIVGVSVRVSGGNRAHLLVWSIDRTQEFEELAVDLANSGTGVGQALAILYVIVSSDYPRIIVIDEPNSFLHPSAARMLISILRSEPHQYIISTHAAEIIALTAPSTLHLLRWDGEQTVVEALDGSQVVEVRRALTEIGSRLSDVFGADQVLWTEGQTEQECFPLIAQHADIEISAGTSICAIRNTGDLSGRKVKAQLAWELYQRLSQGNGLIPPAVGFSFDREGRTQLEIDDLVRFSKGKAHFLPRKTYENYLIHSSAIASLLTAGLEKRLGPEDVQSWLDKHGGLALYEAEAEWNAAPFGPAWLNEVHGAKLLEDLFNDLSNARLIFRKPTDPLKLTEWLLRNEPAHLAELTTYVSELLRPTSPARAGM